MAAEPVPPAAPEPAAAGGRAEPRHWLRIFVVWLVLALAADLVIWFVWAPHLPPGTMTTLAAQQQFDIAILAVSGAPVVVLVWVYFGYALISWRRRGDEEGRGDEEDGPHLVGGTSVQAAWIIGTSVVVLWLFAFGFFELVQPGGSGGGEGPSPIWKMTGTTTAAWAPDSGDLLQVQVIGQEWAWSYRFPQFGGMESSQLVLPANTPIEFHVTSLDVIHSFWAYQLGVKADANPGVDNVAYTKTTSQLGSFVVRCNELCGIWHGAMFNYGRVVGQSAFHIWAAKVQSTESSDGLLSAMPAYALTYDPTMVPQLGTALVKVDGITGAAGYYYPSTDPVQP